MTRPKAIGTHAETLVVRYALPWFPHAERLALAGASDRGDIRLCSTLRDGIPDWWPLEPGGVMLEVKAGKAAKRAGALQVAQWAAETETERLNGGFGYAVLVVQRFNPYMPGPAGWSAVMPLASLRDLTNAHADDPTGVLPPLLGAHLWTSTVRDVFQLLRYAGYGVPYDPNEQESPTP